MKKTFGFVTLSLLSILTFSAIDAFAGQPVDWQLGFQEPASPVMEKLNDMHNFLMVIITAVSVFVLALLVYICIRFHEKNNKTPAKFTHSTKLEIIWTTIPVIILIIISIPALRNLYYMDRIEDADMTLKVIGYQWYWGYEYPDQALAFESYIIKDEDLKEGQVRLLETDNRVVLPVDTNIRVLVTAADVLHAWAVPAFGVKIDAVPGRLNETWMRITKPGIYYGQCSELCGTYHGFMPITIEAVSKRDFARWVKGKGKQFATGEAPVPTKQAAIKELPIENELLWQTTAQQ